MLVNETEARRPPFHPPDFPKSKKKKQYIKKIIRLITMMDDLPAIDCDVW